MACNEVRNCVCPNKECENHSKCCECVAKHSENGNLPFCLKEKTERK